MPECDIPFDDDNEAQILTIYLALTTDGTEVQKDTSFTPVTVKILNLGAKLRSLMSNIRMLAVFPEGVKDYNSLLGPITLELHKRRPGGGNPIRVRHPRTKKPMHLYLHLAYTVNDLRGVPACTGGKHAPCIEGSCWICRVRGLNRLNRTIVPAAVRLLPAKHDLRRKWAEEFEGDDTMHALANMKKPAKRTKVEALASAERFKTGSASVRKVEPFKTVSAFSKHLEDHDVTRHTKSDLAHTFGNTVKLLGTIVTDTAASNCSAFGSGQRKAEQAIGRFTGLSKGKGRNAKMTKKQAAERIKYTPAKEHCTPLYARITYIIRCCTSLNA